MACSWRSGKAKAMERQGLQFELAIVSVATVKVLTMPELTERAANSTAMQNRATSMPCSMAVAPLSSWQNRVSNLATFAGPMLSMAVL